MHLPNLFTGFGMGLVLGIVIGASWEKGFELIREARQVRQRRRNRMSQSQYISEGAKLWLRRMGFLLAFTSVMMLLIGGFLVYSNSRLTNFIQCQAHYNQQAAVARKARLESSAKENRAFYAWLNTLPALIAPRSPGTPPDPEQVRVFRQALIKAIETHQRNVDAQRAHPYPPDPEDTCGEY